MKIETLSKIATVFEKHLKKYADEVEPQALNDFSRAVLSEVVKNSGFYNTVQVNAGNVQGNQWVDKGKKVWGSVTIGKTGYITAKRESGKPWQIQPATTLTIDWNLEGDAEAVAAVKTSITNDYNMFAKKFLLPAFQAKLNEHLTDPKWTTITNQVIPEAGASTRDSKAQRGSMSAGIVEIVLEDEFK